MITLGQQTFLAGDPIIKLCNADMQNTLKHLYSFPAKCVDTVIHYEWQELNCPSKTVGYSKAKWSEFEWRSSEWHFHIITGQDKETMDKQY